MIDIIILMDCPYVGLLDQYQPPDMHIESSDQPATRQPRGRPNTAIATSIPRHLVRRLRSTAGEKV
jgi:hypothetical protein